MLILLDRGQGLKSVGNQMLVSMIRHGVTSSNGGISENV